MREQPNGPQAAAAARRPLRKDAEVNRERLLTAAREVFAESGLDVTMHDIAARAGVGVGTAYRRFANRDEIIDALFGEHVTQVAAIAASALEDPDAWNGLTTFLERLLQLQQEDRGLMEILNNPRHAHRFDGPGDRITPLIGAIIDRAKDQGALRADFEPTDLLFLQYALAPIMDRTRELHPALYRRYLTMFLDGIRADCGPRSAFPVSALTPGEAQAAITQGLESFRRPAPRKRELTMPLGETRRAWSRL